MTREDWRHFFAMVDWRDWAVLVDCLLMLAAAIAALWIAFTH